MSESVPPEIIFMIIADLTPSGQFSLAFTSRRLWSILAATIDRHRSLAQECAHLIQGGYAYWHLRVLRTERPYLLPYVEYFQGCPRTCQCRLTNMKCEHCYRIPDHIASYLEADPRDRKWGAYRIPPFTLLSHLLPNLLNLTRIEFQIPDYMNSIDNSHLWLTTRSLQHLTQITFWAETQLPLIWLRVFLSLPSICVIRGRSLNSFVRPLEWIEWMKNPTIPAPSTSVRELILTNSVMHEVDFDMSHILMDTFLYHHVESGQFWGHDPSHVIQRLPKSLKHLAVIEFAIQHSHHIRRTIHWIKAKLESTKASSLIHFQELKILWCSWPIIVPTDADLEQFDLSAVLPKSLTWLVLFSVPYGSVEILVRALPKMTHLKMIWAQVQSFDEELQHHFDGLTQESQHTSQFRETALSAGLSWVGPENSSVFSPHIKNIQIRQWPQ